MQYPVEERRTAQATCLALIALAGTLAGYAVTTACIAPSATVRNYAALGRAVARPAALPVVPATSGLQAGPVDTLTELGSNFAANLPSEFQFPVPQQGILDTVPSGLSNTLAVSGVVAFFAGLLFSWVQNKSKQPALSYAGPAVQQATSPQTQLNAGPLDGFFDKRKTVVITGASSGLGLQTARALANSGQWYVIMACRNVSKAKAAAKELGLKEESYEVMQVELESLRSVRSFCKELKAKGRTIDSLVCNAALYLPNQRSPDFTEDGFERCFQVNHLSHYLMIRLLMDEIAKSSHKRIVVVGSITGNNNTVGGGAVYPLADLGKLQGLKAGMKEPICMLDGKPWNGAKAYKDSKVCNMMTVRELHRRYHKQLGITFSTMYPGCIAETALFRQKRGWFRFIFPLFMKYVTGGYVSQEEAGDRLAECVDSPATKKSGVYWSWNGGARTIAYFSKTSPNSDWALTGAGGSGGALFENEPSPLVRNPYLANEVYELSEQICELKPDPRAKNAEPALP